MRFDTFRMSAFLVNELQKARPHIEVTEDGCDIIHVRIGGRIGGDLAGTEMVYIYLIESPITVDHILNIVETNTAQGVYSLFILWSDLLLPADGARYVPDDWMALFLKLGGGRIYGFDPYAEGAYIFPALFERAEHAPRGELSIRYGAAINAAHLHGLFVKDSAAPFAGGWRMASFEDVLPPPTRSDRLRPWLNMLGLPADRERFTRAEIKHAYRTRARDYHPDMNPGRDTTALMQRLNEAYTRLLDDADAPA